MDLKNLKIDLPKNWKEISRSGGENQVIIRLCHIDPLTKVDPKIFKSQTIPSPGLEFSIFRAPVPIPTDQETLKDFHEGMISIARYPTEEIARQTFKNMALTPTQGLNVPVPGGVQIPGMPQNITVIELLKSGIFKKYLPKEQLEQLEKAMPKLKEFQKMIQEQAKPDLEKLGAKFKEGKYLGHEAIYIECKNPLLRPQTEQIPISAGGGGIHLDPLPKISQPYSEKFNMYQAILVKNFIITGDLLHKVGFLPPGNTPCYSLTKTKQKTGYAEGIKFASIVPIVSNYEKEGYLHKEEVEEILKKIITALVNK